MNPELKEVIIDGEKIKLSKSPVFGWGVVYPLKNDDGSINWKNLIFGGSYLKTVLMWLIILLILGAALEYSEMYNQVNNLILSNSSNCIRINPLV